MPRASILLMLACLRIDDRPMAYQPPVGPEVDFQIAYNQYEKSQEGQFVTSNLGNNWVHPWQSYVRTFGDPRDGATVVLEGGGYAVEWHAYPMPHSLCEPEVADIRAFLRRIAALK